MWTEKDLPIIEDPLKWQDNLDSQDQPLNMRGSARFWKTCEARGITRIYSDGAPEFSEIVFDLGNRIGLRLWTNHCESDAVGMRPNINFAFCEIESDKTPDD